MSNPNYEPRFDGYYYLVDSDFTGDGKLICSPNDKDKVFLVMVFATWCHNCQNAKNEYAQMMSKVDNNKVRLCLVNGSTDRGKVKTSEDEIKLTKRLKSVIPSFVGFPHFAVFKSKDGSNNLVYVDSHKGPRTVEALKETLSKYI